MSADPLDDVAEEQALSIGEHISISITHEVSFPGGDKAWIKYGVITAVRDGETPVAASDRADKQVQEGSLRVVQSTAETINRASSNHTRGGF